MRRAIARGRIVPQSLSTDPRIGQLSLKAALLYDRLWINADDQGRLSGNPNEIKYACCPNIDHIPKTDIPELLKELDEQGLIEVYTTSKTKAIQMLDWWEEQRLQWAYPSRYPPPEGWTDHLRYHSTPTEIIKENWPPPGQLASELLPSKLPSPLPKELPSKLQSEQHAVTEKPLPEGIGENLLKDIIIWGPPITGDTKPRQSDHAFVLLSLEPMAPFGFDFNQSNLAILVADVIGETHLTEFPSFPSHKVIESRFGRVLGSTFPNWISLFSHISSIPELSQNCIILESSKDIIENEKEKEGGKRRGRGNLPSALGSRSPPSPADLCTDRNKIINSLVESFRFEFGRVPAESPGDIIAREPSAKERAQLRDLAKELSAAGGCPLSYIREAFREAAGQEEKSKKSVSYVRAILRQWLGVARGPPE